MEPEVQNTEVKEKHPVFKVTTLSKYLAMILFILMPFVGGYVGYVYAPEKVVEIEVKEETPQKTNILTFGEDSKIYNWGDYNNKYAVDKTGVYCLVELNDKLMKNYVPDLNPETFKVLKNTYVKDNNGIYKVLCPKSNEVSVSRYEVSDIASFEVIPGLEENTGPNIFADKNYVYLSRPQEFSIERIDVDRSTFKSLGFGEERSVDLMDGQKDLTKDFYFKDRTSVYVIEYGQFKKLTVSPENFDIESYERMLSE